MRHPQIVVGVIRRVGQVHRLDDDRVAARQQALEQVQVAIHTRCHAQPARKIVDVVFHLVRVHIAVLWNRLDDIRDGELITLPAVHFERHAQRGRAAVVHVLLFVGRGLQGNRRRQGRGRGGRRSGGAGLGCRLGRGRGPRRRRRLGRSRGRKRGSRGHRPHRLQHTAHIGGEHLPAPEQARMIGRVKPDSQPHQTQKDK